MFRIYLRRAIDGKYIRMDDGFIHVDETFYCDYSSKAQFLCMKLPRKKIFCKSEVVFEELFIDEVKADAIKAANDHNRELFMNTDTVNSYDLFNNSLFETRNKVQEVIDRSRIYGNDFDRELELILKKYPLKVSMAQNRYRVVEKA